MNRYIVSLNVLGRKKVYVEAENEENAGIQAIMGEGIQIGPTPEYLKTLSIEGVETTNLEIKVGTKKKTKPDIPVWQMPKEDSTRMFELLQDVHPSYIIENIYYAREPSNLDIWYTSQYVSGEISYNTGLSDGACLYELKHVPVCKGTLEGAVYAEIMYYDPLRLERVLQYAFKVNLDGQMCFTNAIPDSRIEPLSADLDISRGHLRIKWDQLPHKVYHDHFLVVNYEYNYANEMEKK